MEHVNDTLVVFEVMIISAFMVTIITSLIVRGYYLFKKVKNKNNI